MIPLVSIYIGGILTLLLAIFHTRFYKEFNWRDDFDKIPIINSKIFYTVHLALLLLFFMLGITSIIYANELSHANGLAFGFNLFFAIFWLWRFIWQFVYFKWENGQKTPPIDIVLKIIFLFLFLCYFIPVIYRFLQ